MVVHCKFTLFYYFWRFHVKVVRLKFNFNNYNEYSIISRNILCEYCDFFDSTQ